MDVWKLWLILAVVVVVTAAVVLSTPGERPVFHGKPLSPAQNAEVRGALAR